MRTPASLGLTLCLMTAVATVAPAQESLEQRFQDPPAECRPGVFMDWMGGMLSKEGLTRDFEALAREGIGSAMVMQMPDQLAGVVQWPFRDYPGKIVCLSDEWFDMAVHAVAECDRLGMTFATLPCPGWSHAGGPWVTPEKGLKVLVGKATQLQGPSRFDAVLARAVVPYEKKPTLPDWASDAKAWEAKRAGYGDYYRDVAVVAYQSGPVGSAGTVVPREKVLNLTAQVDDQGRLKWEVPEGAWTVLRLGCATFRGPNYPAQVEGAGLECDRMDPAAVRLVLENYVGRIAREARARGLKAYTGFDTDSYESGIQDFSEDFPAQFQKRMGYDCTTWLPAWYDRKLIIGSPELTARFRRDMLQVVSQLWLERFYGEIRRFAESSGLEWMVEPYFKLTIDWRTVAARSHLPGSEFWIRDLATRPDPFAGDLTGPGPDSAALYGQPIVWAEAFTASPHNSAWRNDPWLMKPCGDTAFCQGINRFMIHGFTHNPFGDQYRPGFSFGWWGTQLNRHLTWWPYSSAWHRYLARCQFMLRQGLPVADVLSYPPRTEHIPGHLLQCAPFKENVCNDETLLERLAVHGGRLVLPHGVSYAALALPLPGPRAQRTMTPQALRRILELVRQGATLIGEPVADRSASLQDYPQCDDQMRRLVADLWGDDPSPQGSRTLGKGRVIWGRPVTEVLREVAAGPDFEFLSVAQFEPGETWHARYDFFHRRAPDAEIYFVANPRDEVLAATGSFRVTGRQPQWWDPVTGRCRSLPEYREADGHTEIPLRLLPRQSCFIVFRQEGTAPPPDVTERNCPDPRPLATIEGPWQVAFDPNWGGPEQVEFATLDDWTTRPEEGIKYYSGTATYTKVFDAPALVLEASGTLYLDLGKVRNLARVKLNGADLGIVWCAPWRVEVGGALQEENNRLEIDVVNTWVNRIIGDEQLPADTEMVPFEKGGYREALQGFALKDLPDWLLAGRPRPSKRYTFLTWQFYPKEAPLPQSGLLGPVQFTVQ
ncbi:MAG: glycosyl hydrolase [Thermoguttaceae bacterium]